MREFRPIEAPLTEASEELTPLERREQVIGRLLLEYSDVLQDGRYDMAFNRLSRHLFHLRSIQFEVERDREEAS
jgi:hypothetical protein